ncbi:1-deoxy-D-xylulose 5-phosphate reductoisomerase [Alteribacillus persepolensis]|uniref:1-deoxy-D-xylulose 5-phosphate reductoisomerase n=1 Tax=Alteribacillus persepolensis TaxID=568899 RepID=A0A1G7YR84_9BACI|nr:1-deoxy-D-xylulose-5-phosphate reductoisomerase [Alteribacillus persepolensis]SDG98971.1 1-deoxy-D-xylulose 5-phosphate reductoisomerase [Alteribacillus persepolensis]
MKNIALIGSTGSIGTQTLDIIRTHRDEFNLVSIAAGRNIELVLKQIREFSPNVVAVERKQDAEHIQQQVDPAVKVLHGKEGLLEAAVADNADFLMNALVGSLGLEPTLQAMEAGMDIGIANKETLVTAGHLVTEKAKKHQVQLLPVDSEHSAIFQSLEGNRRQEVERLIVTASGGSFRDRSRSELEGVSVEDALKHPNWQMGAKITIDSATMMNKGFEVIEAHWLFDMSYDDIDVVLHKESIIHSLVEYRDKSVLAQLGSPDMRVPIQYAMSYPNRLELNDTERLNLWEIGKLHFEKPDFDRYRCLRYAYEAGRTGGTLPTVLNAANEEAVRHFLNGQITFLSIETHIEEALGRHQTIQHPDLDTILEVDKETREFVSSRIG